MKFLLLIYGDQDVWDGLDEDAFRAMRAAHLELFDELTASGELIGDSEVAEEDATVVRSVDGVTELTDGPLRQGRYAVGGFYLLDCAGVERATEIAARFGEAAFAPIEVRRLSAGSSWDADPKPT